MIDRLYKPKEIIKLGLLGYKWIESIRPLLRNWELESINISSGKRPTYLIKQSAIIKFLKSRAVKKKKKEVINKKEVKKITN